MELSLFELMIYLIISPRGDRMTKPKATLMTEPMMQPRTHDLCTYGTWVPELSEVLPNHNLIDF